MKNTTACNRKAASKFAATQRKIAEFLYQKDRAFIPFDIRLGSGMCMPEYYDAIEELEGKLEKLIEKDAEMRRKVEICCAYKGVGNVTATQLFAHIPELGKLRKNEIVSLAGCAHFARDNRTQRDIDQPKETAGSL